MFLAPVSFSIKPKDDTTPATLKPALPLEHSSDEETQPNSNKADQSSHANSKDLPLPPNFQQANLCLYSSIPPGNGEDCANHSSNDLEQSDSFIRDAILEQQNLNEKRLVKRGITALFLYIVP